MLQIFHLRISLLQVLKHGIKHFKCSYVHTVIISVTLFFSKGRLIDVLGAWLCGFVLI